MRDFETVRPFVVAALLWARENEPGVFVTDALFVLDAAQPTAAKRLRAKQLAWAARSVNVETTRRYCGFLAAALWVSIRDDAAPDLFAFVDDAWAWRDHEFGRSDEPLSEAA